MRLQAPSRFLLASGLFTAGLLLTVSAPGSAAAADPGPDSGDTALIEAFADAVRREVASGAVSGVSVALVRDQRILYVAGFGMADKRRRVPASSNTVYRCGSISKLFTALSVMQLVEQGGVDIDAPVTRYDPEFRIVNPFPEPAPVTLRQLMCHRSGLVRESPMGSYFDDSEPGTARTVRSLESCVLVHPPGTRTKYSNSGVTVAGHVVALVSGMEFEEYQEKRLLEPMGMASSAFALERNLKSRLAKGYLPVATAAGGFEEIEAPQFEFGILPAGNLYTTAGDLARFLTVLFRWGELAKGRLVKEETLREMFRPQLTTATNGFGLGFSMGMFRGSRSFGHNGAVYGFSSSLLGLVEEKLGVIVLINDDIAMGPAQKLTEIGLGLLLAAKRGEPPPTIPALRTGTSERFGRQAAALAGEYESESYWARIELNGTVLSANISCQKMVLIEKQPAPPENGWTFEANGRFVFNAPIVFKEDTFSALGQTFRRVSPERLEPAPAHWKRFLGSYGPAFIPLIISIKHGHLYAMTENMMDYRLTPLNQSVFKMPPGLYVDEQLVFETGRNGAVHGVVLANMKLPRLGPVGRRGGR